MMGVSERESTTSSVSEERVGDDSLEIMGVVERELEEEEEVGIEGEGGRDGGEEEGERCEREWVRVLRFGEVSKSMNVQIRSLI